MKQTSRWRTFCLLKPFCLGTHFRGSAIHKATKTVNGVFVWFSSLSRFIKKFPRFLDLTVPQPSPPTNPSHDTPCASNTAVSREYSSCRAGETDFSRRLEPLTLIETSGETPHNTSPSQWCAFLSNAFLSLLNRMKRYLGLAYIHHCNHKQPLPPYLIPVGTLIDFSWLGNCSRGQHKRRVYFARAQEGSRSDRGPEKFRYN